jgi:arylsulfatase A-like enzyme
LLASAILFASSGKNGVGDASAGLNERAILIITSDHGEAFGEHGAQTHGTTLYEEELRVPLLIRIPSRRARKVEQLVTLLDLGPTVLDLFHQKTPGYFIGQSLVPFLIGQSPTMTRPVAAEARLKQAMIFPNGMKIIYDTRTGSAELYDLRRDPDERHDLSGDSGKLRESLEELRSFFAIHTLRTNGYQPPLVR